MTLSRTARVLIAMLLLAAAAFFWVNFFSQKPVTSPLLGGGQGAGTSGGGAATVAPSTPGAVVANPDASPNAAADASAPAGAAEGGAGTTPGATTEPTVVVPGTTQVATRDVEVSPLPFLVTEPPPVEATTESGAASGNGVTRPGSEQRATVNPFSPILVQAAPSTSPSGEPRAAPDEVVTASGDIIIDDASAPPPATLAAAEPVRAPAPRPLAPATSQTAALPRALPAGTLPVTPGILRSVRTAPVASAPDDIGRLAAVREPVDEAVPAGTLARVGTDAGQLGAATALQPLGPAEARADAGSTPSGNEQPPLAAGTDGLSRYLRDNNVRFTGSVLGPVSVGVFRSAVYTAPVVLALGQSLPDTSIVLTDIRGHEARFSQDATTQTLSLELRR